MANPSGRASKVRMVLDRSNGRIVCLNPAGDMDMSTFFCVMLFFVDIGLAICRPPIQGILRKCLEVFIVSKIISQLLQW